MTGSYSWDIFNNFTWLFQFIISFLMSQQLNISLLVAIKVIWVNISSINFHVHHLAFQFHSHEFFSCKYTPEQSLQKNPSLVHRYTEGTIWWHRAKSGFNDWVISTPWKEFQTCLQKKCPKCVMRDHSQKHLTFLFQKP